MTKPKKRSTPYRSMKKVLILKKKPIQIELISVQPKPKRKKTVKKIQHPVSPPYWSVNRLTYTTLFGVIVLTAALLAYLPKRSANLNTYAVPGTSFNTPLDFVSPIERMRFDDQPSKQDIDVKTKTSSVRTKNVRRKVTKPVSRHVKHVAHKSANQDPPKQWLITPRMWKRY